MDLDETRVIRLLDDDGNVDLRFCRNGSLLSRNFLSSTSSAVVPKLHSKDIHAKFVVQKAGRIDAQLRGT